MEGSYSWGGKSLQQALAPRIRIVTEYIGFTIYISINKVLFGPVSIIQ